MSENKKTDSVKRPLSDLNNSNDESLTVKKLHTVENGSNGFEKSSKVLRSPKSTPSSSTTAMAAKDSPFSIKVGNYYDSLSMDSQSNVNDLHNAEHIASVKKHAIPPPITVVGAADFKKCLDTINMLEIKKFQIKHMSIGTKFSIENAEHYQQLVTKLKKENIQFFTHDQRDEKPVKFVLSGLPEIEHNTILTDLKSYGLTPLLINAVKLSSNKARFDAETIYIISFKCNSVKLNELQKIKAINHTIVKWRVHSNKNRGPTQCNKCFMFGHGGRNCHLEMRCEKCSGKHDSAKCIIDTNKAVCCNCKGNHFASNKTCKKREEFISMRMKLSSAANSKQVTRNQSRPFSYKMNEFPALHPNARIPTSTWPFGNQWTFNRKSHIDLQPPAPTTLNPTSDNVNNLFTTEEIISVTKEVFSGLKLCKSKEEQLEVIFAVAAKYIYGST